MDSPPQNVLRQTFDAQFIRSYLDFTPPTTAPNFLLLDKDYQFSEKPGYEEFLVAFELEYDYNRAEEAGPLYEIACNLGHPLANYCHGLWYLSGDRPETPKDLRKAFVKFCSAHKCGLGQATYQLADYYRTGKGKIVVRDAKKSYAFLIQSIRDPRIHLLLDGVPFWMLGLAYALGRGPTETSMTEAWRCFNRAMHLKYYRDYFINPSIVQGPADRGGYESVNLIHMSQLIRSYDTDEIKKQIDVRLNSMDEYLKTLPPGRSMMTLPEFVKLAKNFGLNYDDFLLHTVPDGKRGKRMTWKTFRRQSGGHARFYYQYKGQVELEKLLRLEPEDEQAKLFLAEMKARYDESQQIRSELDEDYTSRILEHVPTYAEYNAALDNGNPDVVGENSGTGMTELDQLFATMGISPQPLAITNFHENTTNSDYNEPSQASAIWFHEADSDVMLDNAGEDGNIEIVENAVAADYSQADLQGEGKEYTKRNIVID